MSAGSGLPDPDLNAALATAGTLLHFLCSDPVALQRYARFMELHPGDLDEETVAPYLAKVHAVLEPGCPYPADVRPGLAGDEAMSGPGLAAWRVASTLGMKVSREDVEALAAAATVHRWQGETGGH